MAGEFRVLLSSLLSPDGVTRNQAEERFNSLDLSVKLPHLISALKTSGNALDIKTMAAVLLRRIFIKSSNELAQVNPTEMSAYRAELLDAIRSEEDDSIRRKICDAVAELARDSIDDNDVNHWPQALTFLFDCCSLNHPQLYESALRIIRIVPAIFANQLDSCIDLVRSMLLQALTFSNQAVADEALKATCSFVVSLEYQSLRARLFDLLPHMLTVLERSIELQDDDASLKAFIDLGEHRPKYLRSQLLQVIQLMLKAVQTDKLEESWRQLSLEMIITLAENASAMVRKHSQFLPQIVECCLKFMLEVEDDEEWSIADKIGEDEDSSSNAICGETALDRLANALGGKAVLPYIIKIIPSMLTNADWRYRHAALMAISAVGEGCEKQMGAVLEEVVTSVLPFCQDPHYRVRYAACNSLGQMSTDFAPRLQEKLHSKIVPALLLALDDFQNPRVQTHAGAALVNFSEQCPKSILAGYLSTILPRLAHVFKIRMDELVTKGKKLVLEQLVTTLATVADVAEEHFVPFYDQFMPSLKYIMVNATTKEYRLLRGKTIECISLIGLAVGQEKFMQDAQEVMDLLLKVQHEQGAAWEADDPQASYMLSAWARMCKIIGSAFVQYLPIVIQPLIQAASIKPEFAIVDSVEAEQQYSEEEGWEFIPLADQQKFGIKTAGLEDKCTAMQMLVVYAKDLKEGFAEYADPVAKIMVPHLRFYFHELVRASAAEILPHLLECIKLKGLHDDQQTLQEMWTYISDKLLEAIPLEPDAEVSGIMMDSLCRCIELLGANCFTLEQYNKVYEIIRDKLDSCFRRLKERQARREDEDYDEQVEEELEEEDETDEETITKVTDVMHSLFKTHSSTLLPLFEQLLPTFYAMLTKNYPPVYRQCALCVFDDLLEFAGQNAVTYRDYFLEPMLVSICDSSAAVRQAAAYGVGLLAQYCKKDFSQTCLDALSLLIMAVQADNAREDYQGVVAAENGISAITKICQNLEGVPFEEILPLWFSWLPVVEDKIEAVHVYSYLCDQIERNNPLILGQNNTNVPRILSIVGEVVAENVLATDQQVLQRLLTIARHVQASGEVWESCLRYLNEKQRCALTAALA